MIKYKIETPKSACFFDHRQILQSHPLSTKHFRARDDFRRASIFEHTEEAVQNSVKYHKITKKKNDKNKVGHERESDV